MLRQAGVEVEAEPAAVDEDALKAEAERRGLGPARTALLLADAKARAVAAHHPRAFVIGADQILVCAGRVLSKPGTVEDAAATLRFLRGRTHRLLSAVTLVGDGRVLWQHVDRAVLTMRAFSASCLADYVAVGGTDLLTSVGAYRVEGRGIQLFSRIEGDHFTILGMPLLPLLAALRRWGVVAE